MAVFKSPGVYVVEKDITIVNSSKKYNRRLKICRIFTTDVSNKTIITSVSKSGPVNSPKNIDSSNFSEFFSKNLFLDEKQTFKYII